MFRPIKVMDLELSDCLTDVDGLHGYGGMQALVRINGVPIGYVSVPVEGGRCTAESLRRRLTDGRRSPLFSCLPRDRIEAWRASPSMSLGDVISRPPSLDSMTCPMVTVAVCTRNRPAHLAVCLRALLGLRYPRLDVLIVDNVPANDEVERLVRSYSGIRYVREPRPGLNWARNRAIAEARGDIMAYTDDDVVVDPLWVDALARIFVAHDDVMAVTGLVVPYELDTEPQMLFERRGGFGRGFERRWYRCPAGRHAPPFHLSAWTFGTGANMAFRRRLFEGIGGFDPALDVGTVSNGGGDLEMFFRILEEGHTLVYEPAALVRHRHRRDYAALRSQMRDNGIGRSAFLVRSALAYPERRRAIARFWLTMLRGRLLGILRSVALLRRQTGDLLLADLAGSCAGLVRYWKARRIAADITRTLGPIAHRAHDLGAQPRRRGASLSSTA